MDDPRTNAGKLQPKDMPSPPAVLARVIRMANDSQISMEQLSTVVASDPAFAAEIIRMANSAFYGAQTQVKTTARAMVLLGGRTVRCLAICFAARDTLKECGFGPDDLTDFWEDSLRRAAAARRLARMTRLADPEEAFTVGMLLEFGIIAVLRQNPAKLPGWRQIRTELPDPRRVKEAELFGTTHDRVARELTSQWGLPPGLVLAIAHHHHPESPSLPIAHVGLARIAKLSDVIAAVYTASDARGAMNAAKIGLSREFQLSSDAIDELLNAVSGDVTEAASAFGVRVRRQPSQVEILEDANRALTALNLSYEELTGRLERALREKEELATELQKANQRLQELVFYDPLTGLANRRRLEETFLAELARMRGTPSFLSLLVLDLDHFKMVNDQHGHVTGDAVLKAVAVAIQRGTRATDIPARFGGEEMTVLMPATSEEDARRVADRLRRSVEAIEVQGPKGRVAVTVSIGGTTLRGTSLVGSTDGPRRMRQIIEEADQALYTAKRAGRNRVVWSSETRAGDVETF
jgi:diguanylate cyclase (GGDEF)-like protein